MRVMVTGGAGFVGSNLAAAYLRDGRPVTVLDSLRRAGTQQNLRWLMSLPHADRLTFVQGDVRDAELVRDVVGDPEVELVFHLAAQTAVTRSLIDPREDLEVNLVGTFNVLEAVRTSRARTTPALFYTSTNKVYGALSHRAIVETPTRYRFAEQRLDERGVDENEPLDFHSPYGCSKGAAGQYALDYQRIYGLRTVVFRMSCIYGPRQFGNEDQGWLAHFLIAAAVGQPLTIYGSGKQVRDVLHIDDLVRAFRMAAEQLSRTAGKAYNIGGGPANSLSVWQELCPRLVALRGQSIGATMAEWRPGDQPVYTSDSGAAHRDFGWQPQIGIDEGLQSLWSWILDNRSLFEPLAAAARSREAGARPKSKQVASKALDGRRNGVADCSEALTPVPAGTGARAREVV